MKKIFLFSMAALICCGALMSQKSIQIEQYTLENGLTVFLYEDHSRPEVLGMVTVKTGSKNDPADATGLAHYQEHMLFKGTQEMGTTDWVQEKFYIDSVFMLYDSLGITTDPEKRKTIQQKINRISLKAGEFAIPNEFSNLIKSIGGKNMNAGTGSDMTTFFNSFPPNQTERWLTIYSHRFMQPVFRSFQAELEVVYEEKNMYSDIFVMNILENFNKSFFKNHPYGQQSSLGTIEHLKNPSLTKMYNFFKTYYVANNMALILSGDFQTAEIKPLIEETFGKLSSGTLPEAKTYPEDPFRGREFVEVKMSPIKIGLLGFRTVPNNHPDEIPLEICRNILSNSSQTGLMDRLMLENQLMAAQVIPFPYNDHGAVAILIVPKILGQKLEEAEQLIMKELEKLKKGEFDDWLLDAIKINLYKQFEISTESYQSVASIISEAFSQHADVKDYFAYPEKIKKVTKEQVMKTAQKYFGENYLAFYSLMGFPKKEKIEKPGYKPLVVNTNAKSEFSKKLEHIPANEQKEKFVNFTQDIKSTELKKGAALFYVENPKNDIFSLTIKFGVGNYHKPLLKYASGIMNYSGTKEYKVNELKNEFSKLGCSYQISCDDSYLTVSMDGVEENFPKAVALIRKLIAEPVLEKEKIKKILEEEKTTRKIERSEPDNVADALFSFVRFNKKSSYIDRFTLKEIENLSTDSLVSQFRKACEYECEVHYCGKTRIEKIKSILLENMLFSDHPVKSDSPVVPKNEQYNENTVFFVDKKKAVQSKIFFFMNGKPYDIKDQPDIDAFNLYFGGDFSGLVLQEIREYRSMSYTAGAGVQTPRLQGKEICFVGFVGTQADKTVEAIEVFNNLVRDMPEKDERINMIQQYLTLSALTLYPDFRNLSQQVERWKLLGYQEDPAISKIKTYKESGFENITRFYKNNLKEKPMVICIVGNKKKIDMKALEKYGKVVSVKENSLFSK